MSADTIFRFDGSKTVYYKNRNSRGTDAGKSSLKGRVTLWQSGGEYETSVTKPTRWTDKGFEWIDAMETYFEDGEVKFTQTFDEVRANTNL